MFRRWRVRPSYPKPVELAVRLMPIHGVAPLSRLLGIPMSVIYGWRTKNRDCAPLSANAAADAETLATLVAQCEGLVSRLGRQARATTSRARAPMNPPRHESTYASLADGSSGNGADAFAPLRILSDRAESHGGHTEAAIARKPSSLQPRSRARAHRYVFDPLKERPERGVRRRMESVRRVLDTQYFLDVDCRALADTAQMSLHHFIRVFRDMFGASPYQYLTRARVKAAKRLLLASDGPIEVVAVGVGFRSGPHLNRAFKRIEGQSVSRYCQGMKAFSTDWKQRALLPASADRPRQAAE